MFLKLCSFVALTVLLLGGCASDPNNRVGASGVIQRVEGTELPLPDDIVTVGGEHAYRISPYDRLTIDVFGVPELSDKKLQVDASGRMTFPLVGDIIAAGMTSAELANTIEERLRDRYVKFPSAAVNIDESISQQVTVEGEVREPGRYPVTGRLSLLRALALAKGTTEFSRLSNVVIFRTAGGKDYVALYNIKQIRSGNYADPEVFANDVVVVGDNSTRRIFKDLLQGSSLITTPLIYLITRN